MKLLTPQKSKNKLPADYLGNKKIQEKPVIFAVSTNKYSLYQTHRMGLRHPCSLHIVCPACFSRGGHCCQMYSGIESCRVACGLWSGVPQGLERAGECRLGQVMAKKWSCEWEGSGQGRQRPA